jgi:hypothetical protein
VILLVAVVAFVVVAFFSSVTTDCVLAVVAIICVVKS